MPDLDALLAQMTLDEKAAMLSGSTAWIIPGCERLGISGWTVSDGPIGVRGRGRAPALCLPSPSAWAATWDVDLVAEMGQAIAQEAKDRAIQMVLGPTVNIHRDPRGGRHFECYSEDPLLSGKIATAYIRAVQSQGIGTCVKHFVANDHEFQRHSINCVVGERALREIYLAPFEEAVTAGETWGVMASYNDINGVQGCENTELIEGVMRGEWGYGGLVISDWFASKDTVRTALGGLDIEMPGPAKHWGHGRLADAVRDGRVPEAVVDAKVRRVLTFLEWAGGIGVPLPDTEDSADRPEARTLARRAAAQGMVLLQNDGTLPLDSKKLRTIAVFGPNAEDTVLLGGGSATVSPHHRTNVLEALRDRLRGTVEVIHVPAPSQIRRVRDLNADQVGPDGVEVEVFEGHGFAGDPAIRTSVGRPLLVWNAENWPVSTPKLSVRAEATFVPETSGRWRLGVSGSGAVRMWLGGELVADSADGFVNSNMEQVLAFGWRDLEAGRAYDVAVEFEAEESAMHIAVLRFGGVPDPADESYERRVAEAAAAADVCLVVTGTTTEVESEGADRLTIDLPGDQDALVRLVAEANPRTVVVNNSGSPVLMSWADDVAAILQAWYPGQEGGEAIVDVLFGDAEPGGRMPTTWPLRLEDVPAYTSFPGESGEARYSEGVFVGYRWYDARKIAPQWCFGHGLSYTAFAWSEPRVQYLDNGNVVIEVDVTNAGDRPGSDVVQCYVAPIRPRLMRPEQELKGFARVEAGPEYTVTARIVLDRRAFSAWDPERHDWVVDGRSFEIRLGRSSRDIVATVAVEPPR